jgi:hypothetical protein
MRFFQVRKKLNGMKSIIKRINSKKELDSPIFGYAQYTWYRVKIEVDKENYKIYISKPGQKEFLVFEGVDKDINYGLVGVSSCFTSAGFDNLLLKPKVDETSTL